MQCNAMQYNTIQYNTILVYSWWLANKSSKLGAWNRLSKPDNESKSRLRWTISYRSLYFVERPCIRSIVRPHGIVWENSEQTKLTMEPRPKTKEQRQIRGFERLQGCWFCQGGQGWRSDQSTRLPPMWPGFKSQRRRHMWLEFVVGSLLCSERFFSGYSGLRNKKQWYM